MFQEIINNQFYLILKRFNGKDIQCKVRKSEKDNKTSTDVSCPWTRPQKTRPQNILFKKFLTVIYNLILNLNFIIFKRNKFYL